MLPQTYDTEAFIDYGHRDRRSFCHYSLDNLVAMITENNDSIIFKADEVVIVTSCRAIDFELVRVFFEHLHMLSAHDD